MDAWKRFAELQMKRDMMMANINMQREILEIHKAMWDKPTKEMEEKQTKLNIQNIQKLENQPLVDGKYYPRIESIEEGDNEYLFTIMVDSGVNLKNVRKVICLERNKNLTSDSGVNFYKLWVGDENFESVSSKCISNLDCFKEKLVDMLGMMDLSVRTFPTSSMANFFTDTTSVSGGDSEKLQRMMDLLNGI
jgi:hypothetical protein